jgi:hypothetical protein
MITIGIREIYCCCNDRFIMYTKEEELDKETLNELKIYDNERDIYDKNPLTKILGTKINIYEDTYNTCNFKFVCIMC